MNSGMKSVVTYKVSVRLRNFANEICKFATVKLGLRWYLHPSWFCEQCLLHYSSLFRLCLELMIWTHGTIAFDSIFMEPLIVEIAADKVGHRCLLLTKSQMLRKRLSKLRIWCLTMVTIWHAVSRAKTRSSVIFKSNTKCDKVKGIISILEVLLKN